MNEIWIIVKREEGTALNIEKSFEFRDKKAFSDEKFQV